MGATKEIEHFFAVILRLQRRFRNTQLSDGWATELSLTPHLQVTTRMLKSVTEWHLYQLSNASQTLPIMEILKDSNTGNLIPFASLWQDDNVMPWGLR